MAQNFLDAANMFNISNRAIFAKLNLVSTKCALEKNNVKLLFITQVNWIVLPIIGLLHGNSLKQTMS